MGYYSDLYGLAAEQQVFRKDAEAITDSIAEQLMEILDIDLAGSISESRGGICYGTALYDDGEEPELDVHLNPNRIVEPDDDYWLEEKHKKFALLLSIDTEREDLIEDARKAIQAAQGLGLTLIRSEYHPGIGQPPVIQFSLDAEKDSAS